jgi:hypothetical protein
MVIDDNLFTRVFIMGGASRWAIADKSVGVQSKK